MEDNIKEEEEEFLSVSDIARMLKCGINTVYGLIETKEIIAFRINKNKGQYRILRTSYNEYLKKRIEEESNKINEIQRSKTDNA